MSFIYKTIERVGLEEKQKIAKELGVEEVDMESGVITVKTPILGKYAGFFLDLSVRNRIKEILDKHNVKNFYIQEVRKERYLPNWRMMWYLSAISLNYYRDRFENSVTLACFHADGFYFDKRILTLREASQALDEIVKELYGLFPKTYF